MKKSKQQKHTGLNAGPGYAAQDFEQGRGGIQSGHGKNDDNFNQFRNNGSGGFAAQHSSNSIENMDKGKSKSK